MFVVMVVFVCVFAFMVVVHIVRMGNGSLRYLKIFEFCVFVRSRDIEATDDALVRNKLNLTVVDTLSLHAQYAL